jgi:hypothetical protein
MSIENITGAAAIFATSPGDNTWQLNTRQDRILGT